MGLFLFRGGSSMTTKHKTHRLDEAKNLLDKAQKDDDIFGKTASAISHWADKYGDYRSAWFHGGFSTTWKRSWS